MFGSIHVIPVLNCSIFVIYLHQPNKFVKFEYQYLGVISQDLRVSFLGQWWGRSDIQPILAIHGWQDNSGSFDTLVPLLNVESLLAIDMVGHGQSSHYPIGYCYHYLDELFNIRRIVKHYYKWDKVSIIGHSMGSILGYSYAAYFPDEIDKFISIDCTRGTICQGIELAAKHMRQVFEFTLSVEKKLNQTPPSYSYDDIIDLYIKGSYNSVTRESCKILMKRGLIKSEGTKYRLSRDPLLKKFPLDYYSDQVLYAIASLIKCEVLSIRANGGFTCVGYNEDLYLKSCEIIKKSAKRYEQHNLDGTHHIHLNTPEKVACVINNFLAEKPVTTIC